MDPSNSARWASDAGGRPLRLNIGHIMLWMAGIAISMAVSRLFTSSSARIHWYWQLLEILRSVVDGASLGALALWIWIRIGRRSVGFPRQPGHWALLLSALWCLLEWSQSSSRIWLHGSGLLSVMALCQLLLAAGCFAVAAVNKRETNWLLVFAVMGLRAAVQAGLYGLEVGGHGWLPVLLQIPADALICLTIFIAVMIDVVKGARRDFLHWVGVIQPFIIYALSAVTMWVGRSGMF